MNFLCPAVFLQARTDSKFAEALAEFEKKRQEFNKDLQDAMQRRAFTHLPECVPYFACLLCALYDC